MVSHLCAVSGILFPLVINYVIFYIALAVCKILHIPKDQQANVLCESILLHVLAGLALRASTPQVHAALVASNASRDICCDARTCRFWPTVPFCSLHATPALGGVSSNSRCPCSVAAIAIAMVASLFSAWPIYKLCQLPKCVQHHASVIQPVMDFFKRDAH
jgi:hypothetical protein